MTLPWLRIDRNLHRHPKADLLDATLGERRTWSYVVELWMWAAEMRPTGDLAGIPDAIIAKRAGYEGDAARFVAALTECGWLTAARTLHDWDEYQGARIEKAQSEAQRLREYREAKRTGVVQRTSVVRTTDVPRERDETKRDGTKRGDGDAPSAPAPAPPVAKPINLDRPEPLGPFGERMPRTVDEVVAHVHEGRTLLARWLAEAKPLDELGIRRVVERTMAHRLSLDGPRLRSWFWPGGYITKTDAWLRDEAKKELDRLAAEKRAAAAGARAGEHVTAPAAESQAERNRKHAELVEQHKREQGTT